MERLAKRAQASLSVRAAGVGVLLLIAAQAPACAACADRPCREGDVVLLVSTRPVCCSTDADELDRSAVAERLAGPECDAPDGWTEAPLAESLAELDASLPIVVYVHGNQVSAPEAKRGGLDAYQELTRCADGRPLQLIVFSWCSDKTPGLLRDFRVKAARTRPVAWQLAWMLGKLPAGAPVGLLGYSYGARISTGASHLVAGGALGGLRLEEPLRLRAERPLRGVFLAAAEDACWLAEGAAHGHALDAIENALVTVNPRDPAMKYYKFLPKTGRPKALGGVGPQGLSHDRAARIDVCDVSAAVGRSHDVDRYLGAPGLAAAAWRRLTFADLGGASIADSRDAASATPAPAAEEVPAPALAAR